MRRTFFILLICNILALSACSKDSGLNDDNSSLAPATYYFNSILGNDGNDGLTPETAWKSLDSINTRIWQPGDTLLFHSGDVWYGNIHPKGSGAEGKPIVISSYGTGKRPAIHGNTEKNTTSQQGKTKYATVYLFNQTFWEINNLEITNFNSKEAENLTLEEWEKSNVENYANAVEPPQLVKKNVAKCGILVEAKAKGKISHLHFKNLEIHGVNGDIGLKDNGGIFFHILNEGENVPTWFDDILIEGCHVHDVDRTGISNWSDYAGRTLTTNTDWVPSTNYVLRNTLFERTGANALIVRVAAKPFIENNVFDHCAIKESGNACFNFNTDEAVWQYNEARFTKANEGDEDAGGIDRDYRSKNTVIQYNYIHENDFGMLVTGGSGVFNDGTIVRYNIFEREGKVARYGSDSKFVIRVSGEATNTTFMNNVIFLDADQQDTKIILHKKWGTWPEKTNYYNNIFYNLAAGSSYDFGSSTENEFSNNLFFGNVAAGTPDDPNRITADPLFQNPGNSEEGYKLKSDSPALQKGLRNNLLPAKDYFGNAVPSQGPVDIGIHQLTK